MGSMWWIEYINWLGIIWSTRESLVWWTSWFHQRVLVIDSISLYSGSSSDDFCEFMMPFFSPAAFTGFDNNSKGFYFVYRNAFDSILKKEQ